MNRRDFLLGVSAAGALASPSWASEPVRSPAVAQPRLRIGQIGTGHAHADGKLAVLRRSPDFELVGVVEPDAGLRATAQRRRDYQGVRWMTEAELLATPGLRAVAVETEVKDLLAVGTRGVEAGLHLHLDKPAGESLEEFRRLLALAGRRGVTVQLGYMFRYNPAFELAFRAVREGWLGRVFSIEAVMGKAISAPERAKLRRYRGGAMFELGCHLIDAVVAVLGRPAKVIPVARSVASAGDGFPDHQVALLEYPGATVTVSSALVEVGGNARRQFAVCGETGTMEIRPLEPPAVRLALAAARGGFRAGDQAVPLVARPRYQADFADLARGSGARSLLPGVRSTTSPCRRPCCAPAGSRSEPRATYHETR